MTVSDLNAKIKDLDNEKLSLVTAIKILHEDKKSNKTGPPNGIIIDILPLGYILSSTFICQIYVRRILVIIYYIQLV